MTLNTDFERKFKINNTYFHLKKAESNEHFNPK